VLSDRSLAPKLLPTSPGFFGHETSTHHPRHERARSCGVHP
jgi:hypothetical protein